MLGLIGIVGTQEASIFFTIGLAMEDGGDWFDDSGEEEDRQEEEEDNDDGDILSDWGVTGIDICDCGEDWGDMFGVEDL